MVGEGRCALDHLPAAPKAGSLGALPRGASMPAVELVWSSVAVTAVTREEPMPRSLRFTLNGSPRTLDVDPQRKLLWVLRTELGLTGAKYGCGIGLCGACTVLVDGAAVRSCRTEVGTVADKAVVTIEGLARGGELHPLQEAFLEHGGYQCGYCTSGMILGAHALLHRRPHATRDEIRSGLEGHLCRCGAHQRILAAVEAVASGKGGAS